MKKFAALFLCSMAIALHAQTSGDGERGRIRAERAALTAGFDTEDVACLSVFWVTNCQNDVRTRRVEALTALNRQETLINAQERRLKAAAQLQKIDENLAAVKLQKGADSQASAVIDVSTRQARKAQQAANASSRAQGAIKLSDQTLSQQRAGDRAAAQAKRDAAAVEAQNRLKSRQEKAKQRQDRHDREQALGKPRAKPLPVPP